MAQIIDQYGNPISNQALNQVLDQPQTASVVSLQHRVLESHLDGMTPSRAASILREADAGNIMAQHELFDDMLDRDTHLSSEYAKRCQAPLTIDWRIAPPKDASAAESKAAEYVEDILRTAVDDFEDVLLSMMDAVGHGFAAIELDWKRHGGEWIPSFIPRPQTWFQLNQARTSLTLSDGTGDGAKLWPMGWILHQHRKPKTGYISRSGILRPVVWPFLYKAFSLGDFAEFLDIYGLPIVIGKYPTPSAADAKSSLMRAVAALGRDGRAIMPTDMQIEVMKVTASGDGTPHLSMLEWAERAESKAILGQVLSADAQATGMGSGVANLHGEVRHDIMLSDVRQLAGTLTRDLVYPLIALNVGGIDAYRRCPRFEFDTGDAADLKLFADSLPVLAQNGARISVKWVHEQLQIPEARADETVFGTSSLVPALAQTPPSKPSPIKGEGVNNAATKQAVAPNSSAKWGGLTPSPLVGEGWGEGANGLHHATGCQCSGCTGIAALKADGTPATDAMDDAVDAELADWQAVLEPMVNPLQSLFDEAVKNGETAEALLARLPNLITPDVADALQEHIARLNFAARLAALAGLDIDVPK